MDGAGVSAVYGATNPDPRIDPGSGVRRFGSITELKPEMERRYRTLHANAWPEVVERIKASNIRNYSIYVAELGGRRCLFSYHEYVGMDYAADMAALESCPHTRRWWQETDACQRRLGEGQWLPLECVFHLE